MSLKKKKLPWGICCYSVKLKEKREKSVLSGEVMSFEYECIIYWSETFDAVEEKCAKPD